MKRPRLVLFLRDMFHFPDAKGAAKRFAARFASQHHLLMIHFFFSNSGLHA
jgi:hypothetical protein